MRPNTLITAAFFLTMLASAPAFCADRDTTPLDRHQIQTDLLMLLGVMPNVSYECRFNRHHAALVRGGWQVPVLGNTGWMYGASYRSYFQKRTFWGIFAVKGEQSSKLPSPQRGDTTTFTMDLSYLTIGPNWGKTWNIGERVPLTLCLGAGYPVQNDFSWKNRLEYPVSPALFKTIARFSACLDAGLSIGIGF